MKKQRWNGTLIAGVMLGLVVAVAGCEGGNGSTGFSPSSSSALPKSDVAAQLQRNVAGTTAGASASGELFAVRPYTYVAPNSSSTPYPGGIGVFSQTTGAEVATIPDEDASEWENSIAVDGHGNVYEAHPDHDNVAVYNSQTGALENTITSGLRRPSFLQLDAWGNLYVANIPLLTASPSATPSGSPPTPPPTPTGGAFAQLPPGWVSVFLYGSSTPAVKITSPPLFSPTAIAFDNTGDVYVANASADDNRNQSGGSVIMYAPHGFYALRTITKGIDYPISLAVDPVRGTIYVGNYFTGSVTVYAGGAAAPSYAIAGGNPVSLLVDPSGNLYVADDSVPGGVREYAPGHRTPFRTLPEAFGDVSLALDSAGDLYASSAFDKRVHEYAPNATQPFRTMPYYYPEFITLTPPN